MMSAFNTAIAQKHPKMCEKCTFSYYSYFNNEYLTGESLKKRMSKLMLQII